MGYKGACALFVLAISVTFSLEAISVKSLGRANAGMAYVEDSLGAMENPACAAAIESRYDLGLTWYQALKELEISNRPTGLGLQQGTLTPKHLNQWFPEIAFNVWLWPYVAFGMALNDYDNIYTHYNQRLTDLSASDPLSGDPIGPNALFEYDVRELAFTGALYWNECNRFGVGLNLYWTHLRVEGIGALAPFSVAPLTVTDTGNSHSRGLGVTIGWLGMVHPSVTLGASYCSRTGTSEYVRYLGLLAEQKLDIPETWRFGAAWAATESLTVLGDLEYRRYSRINAWADPFPPSSSTAFEGTFGTKYGPGWDWQDQWTVKLGAVWELDCWIFRAGYRHEQPRMRGHTTDTALNVLTLNTVENFISVGVTKLTECYGEWSGFAEYGFSNTIQSGYPSIASDPRTLDVPLSPANLEFTARSYRAGLAYGTEF